MSERHNIVYIPGLGNSNSREAAILNKLWAVHGANLHYAPMNWGDGRPYISKHEEQKDLIRDLFDQQGPVSVIGTSAGASEAFHLASELPECISGTVSICGKLKHPETLDYARRLKNPDFMESLTKLTATIGHLSESGKLSSILCVKPLWDRVVPPSDAYIEGMKSKTIPTIGHIASILYALTASSRHITQFLVSQVRGQEQ